MKKVITYGSFDLFHSGHLRLLQRAKELGDYLIVGVTTEHYDESRGKLNIVDSLNTRMDNVCATGLADEIIVEDHVGQKVEDVQKYQVDIFTVGSDWIGQFDYLKDYCEVVYLERTKDISSTKLREEANPTVCIGVIGTGRIANRFVPESKYVSGVNVQGVYNPHLDHAKEYADRHELSFATDNLEEFFSQVDAVYIAAPHQFHYEYAKAALEHGKHVLCEKPMCFKRAEAEELFDIAKKNELILMEGIKTAYCPGFTQMIGVAKSGAIGAIRDVEACFTRITNPQLREMTDTEYGGAFTEFGSYALLPIIKLLGTDYTEVRFDSIRDENGIDLYTKASFVYDKGLALTKSGLGVKSEGQLVIAGTKGYILAPSPWWLTKYFEVRYEDASKIDRYSTSYIGYGLRYEIADFARRIGGRNDREYKLSRGESIAIASIFECFLASR